MTLRTVCLFACSCVLFAAQQPKPPEDLCVTPPSSFRPSLPARLLAGQGRSHIPITTRSPEAQQFFDQGLAQMHSFASYEAERSFLQAAQLDPEAPMPQWGIAMVAAGDYRPTFQLMENGRRRARPKSPSPGLQRAREAAEKAVQLSAGAGEKERLYIASVAARRNARSKDADRDYIEALRAIVRRFPEETEAKSFLALALMSGYTTPDKKPRPGTEEAYAILRDIVKQDPDHVGAHHYVIHVLEGSTHPQDAWESCKRYPELAPEVPHALHMPGHIYVQSDRWADAAAAFEGAAKKESALLAADQLYPNGHHGHNVHFLTNAYCFLDRYGDAMARSAELLAIHETPREVKQATNTRTVYRQGWFARMRTLVHFNRWDEILDGTTLPEYPQPRERAWRHWARGLAYSARGDVSAARSELGQMDRQIKAWTKLAGSPNRQLQTARLELEGHITLRAGNVNKGLGLLERAGNSEIHLSYNEPPAYPRPVWEAMGQAALEVREWTRAESAFRRALEQNPGSGRAKQGLSAARSRAGAVVAGQ